MMMECSSSTLVHSMTFRFLHFGSQIAAYDQCLIYFIYLYSTFDALLMSYNMYFKGKKINIMLRSNYFYRLRAIVNI